TKRTFVDVMREFLHEHKLTDTKIETADLIIDNRAQFYRYANNVTENLPTLAFDQLVMIEGWWTAGGLISTVSDMLRFGQLMIDAYKGRPNGESGAFQ